jgi:biopolymer transport protein ExbD
MMGKKNRLEATGIYEPNMTPLIDVSLVLVVILLVATPMALQSSIGVHGTADSARTAAAKSQSERIEVVVASADSVWVNRRHVGRGDLRAVATPLLAASQTRTVAVRCRDGVQHGTVVGVLDELKQLGAMQIAVQGR